MNKVFTTLLDAQAYADSCQALVSATRAGYCADKWDIPRKHISQNKWAVVIPPESNDIGIELTDDWFPAPTLL